MRIVNRRARYDYEILDTFEAGIKLTGAEVKSLRNEKASLRGAFVKIIGNEAYLLNARIHPYRFARQENYDPERSRKLLLHRREIVNIKSRMKGASLTLIPLQWYNKRGLMKLKIALAKGKRRFEKREKKRRKDIERDVERQLRGKK